MSDIEKLDYAVDNLVDNHIEAVIKGYESAFVAICHNALRMTNRFFPGKVDMQRRTIRRILESIDETLSDTTVDGDEIDDVGVWIIQEFGLAKFAIHQTFEDLIPEPWK